jgi:hypothetical protein
MSDLPPLPLDDWRETKAALHLTLQMIGKVRMALHPKLNHWWHTPLYVGPRGFTTGPIPGPEQDVEIVLDVHDAEVRVSTSRGAAGTVPIGEGGTVAAFHRAFFGCLGERGLSPRILARPYDPARVGSDVPFAEDDRRRPWDRDAVLRFWQACRWANRVFTEFRGRFLGKSSPVHLFWHSLDLAHTRFSGRAAPLAGGSASDREAYSHEVVSVGFWAGDDNVPAPAFYAYAYPEPAGLGETPLEPAAAKWSDTGASHLALLAYDDVRAAPDPHQAAFDFCESAYQAAARLAAWDLPGLTAPRASG